MVYNGLRSGEYGGCGTTAMPFLAKTSVTEIAVWQGALGTNFAHNFFIANSFVKIWWTVVWFKFNSLAIIRTESTVWPHKGSHYLHIVISFWSWRSSRAGFIFDGFTALWKCLKPLEHLWSRQSMLPIGLFQFIESFNAGFPKFDTKLDCTSLLKIALSHFHDTHTKTASQETALKLACWY